jgi:hypothetical protein
MYRTKGGRCTGQRGGDVPDKGGAMYRTRGGDVPDEKADSVDKYRNPVCARPGGYRSGFVPLTHFAAKPRKAAS